MIGSEAERQFYLGAAGIRLWYARQPLPGAAPSPEFEFPEEPEAPEGVPGISEPVPRPGSDSGRSARRQQRGSDLTEGVARIADLQALMEGVPGSTARTPRRRPPESVSAANAAPDLAESKPLDEVSSSSPMVPSQSVNLMLWAGGSVALVGDMSADASNQLQETLALNILKSLGETQPRAVGPVCWPVFNNLLVPGNSGHDLVELMRSVLAGLECQQVVVLQGAGGSEPGDSEPGDSEPSWLVEALGRDPAVWFPHTLAEIAGNPALKRSLWQQIRPLAAR